MAITPFTLEKIRASGPMCTDV